MKRNIGIAILAVAMSLGVAVAASAADAKYVGIGKCKFCHMKQYKVWQETKHAKAFESLKGDEAKKYSANPTKDAKCLACHVTGLGKAGGYVSSDDAASAGLEGIQCETCHGAGENYKVMSTMKDKTLAIQNGLIVADEKTCLACHNNKESPVFKDGAWDYNKYYEKIKH